MQQLGPEPLRGVDAAHELQVIDREFFSVRVDGCRLSDGSMIFPENEEGVGIVLKAGQQTQWCTRCIDGNGGRAGGVYRNGFDVGCNRRTGLLKAGTYGGFETFDVVQ